MRRYHPKALAKYTPIVDGESDLLVEIAPIDDDVYLPTTTPLDTAKKTIIDQTFWYDVTQAVNKNMHDDAQRLLVAWLADDPYNIEIMKQLASVYCITKQSKKAFPLYKKVLDIDHHDHKVMSQLARLYIDDHDNESAEMIVRQALHIAPENPKYMVLLVEILYESARYDEAIDIMESVIKIRPSTVQYRDILGTLYEQKELTQEALYCYEHILTIDSANVYARKKIRHLHQIGKGDHHA
jgi:cytochrome c-type biogenesis protein CcmH/NrfG